MKNRKKVLAIAIEKRNAIYNKTIMHNRELAEKNTQLSFIINAYKDKCRELQSIIDKPKWWQFWKHIYQRFYLINETEAEIFDAEPKFAIVTYFYNIPIWRKID
jgi:hypothetical protein